MEIYFRYIMAMLKKDCGLLWQRKLKSRWRDQSFEALKSVNEHGAEYWSARSLQALLGYSQWRRFDQAIERAVTYCKYSGNPPENHFAGAGKPITGGEVPFRLWTTITSLVLPVTSSPRTATGPRFRQRVEAIVEAFSTMQEDLDKERKVIMKGKRRLCG